MQVRPSPLRQSFPSRQLSRLSHQEDAHGSREGKMGGWQGWYFCPSAVKEQLKREPGSFPAQTTFIGVAPMVCYPSKAALKLALFSEKEGIHPKTLNVRKLSQDEETYTASAIQNVPAQKITRKQHGWFTPSTEPGPYKIPRDLAVSPRRVARGQMTNQPE